MLFPFKLRNRIQDPFEPINRIDRELGERGRRLFIGIELQPNFRDINAALTVVEGKGKYMRVVGVSSVQSQLDEPTQLAVQEFVADSQPSLMDWRAIEHDLSLIHI